MKKKKKKQIKKGRIYVQATFNNTIITITDQKGDTVCWGSTGASGFKGSRKATPFAATTTVQEVIQKGKDRGLKEVDMYIKGPGPGRSAVLRAMQTSGLQVKSISDVTPLPHNGVRPPKKRRV